jgi:hypothetical protein
MRIFIPKSITISYCAPLAQLDRAFDYESRGREFESLRVRHTHLPVWRNGRRDGLKIRFLRGSGGSSPFTGITDKRVLKSMISRAFFFSTKSFSNRIMPNVDHELYI